MHTELLLLVNESKSHIFAVYASAKLATRLYGFCLTCQHMSHCNAQDGLGVITICDLDLHQSLCALLEQPWINVLKHTRSRTSVRITKHLQFKLVCWHSHSGLCKSRSLSIYIPTVQYRKYTLQLYGRVAKEHSNTPNLQKCGCTGRLALKNCIQTCMTALTPPAQKETPWTQKLRLKCQLDHPDTSPRLAHLYSRQKITVKQAKEAAAR